MARRMGTHRSAATTRKPSIRQAPNKTPSKPAKTSLRSRPKLRSLR